MSVLSPGNYAKLKTWAIVISIVIPIAVGLLMAPFLPKIALPFNSYVLPPFYAAINGSTALILLASLWAIKQKNIALHQRLNTVAMMLSAIFLVCYVLYHVSTQPTRFGGEGAIRFVYLLFLNTHIAASMAVLPFVLFTYLRGWARMDEQHRQIAKYAFPLWLYVCVTGVIVYLMIAPYYPA